MADLTTFEKVQNLLVEQLGLDNFQLVTPEASIIEDLGADSLDCVEVVMALEEEFDISIQDEEAEKANTVDDLVKLVEKQLPS